MIVLFKIFFSVYANYCSVGVKDRRVADAQMTASNVFGSQYAASQGKLDHQGSSNLFLSGSWSAATR